MTLYQYVAKHNPQGAADIITKYGYKPQKSQATNAEILRHLINQYGQVVINDLATVHPDFDLIVSNYQSPQVLDSKTKTLELPSPNNCGCGGHTNFSGPKCKCGDCNHNQRRVPISNPYAFADGTGAPVMDTVFVFKREHLYLLGAVAAIGTMWLYFKNH